MIGEPEISRKGCEVIFDVGNPIQRPGNAQPVPVLADSAPRELSGHAAQMVRGTAKHPAEPDQPRAAGELWKFCFPRGGGTHAEFIAGVLDRMTAVGEAIDWWERATPQRHQ